MRASGTFVLRRLVALPAGAKYLCDRESSEKADAGMKVLNQVLLELTPSFEANLSKDVRTAD
jgi:hypothetical protein